MSLGLVLGPELPGEAGPGVGEGGVTVRRRERGESPAERAAGLRRMFTDGVATVLLVERALPVRSEWAASGAPFALVADHVNLTGDNPLVGPNADEWGPRFPDLTDAWDPDLRRRLRARAVGAGLELVEGVVAGVAGPARTAAEVSMLRMIGADMASEGFVHEAIVARHAGRRVAGLAILAAGTSLPGEAAAIDRLISESVAELSGGAAA